LAGDGAGALGRALERLARRFWRVRFPAWFWGVVSWSFLEEAELLGGVIIHRPPIRQRAIGRFKILPAAMKPPSDVLGRDRIGPGMMTQRSALGLVALVWAMVLSKLRGNCASVARAGGGGKGFPGS